MNADRTLREAQGQFLRANGLPADGGEHARAWNCRIGPVILTLPNFAWRKRAIVRHDLHHVITGYECGLVGEFEMAAWEFAAGRFDNFFATAFCLPLVTLGAVAAPRRTFAAFMRGRGSETLYRSSIDRKLLDMPLRAARQRFAPQARQPRAADRIAFLLLTAQGASILVAPLLFSLIALFLGL
ncbi:MAG: hypothetical protein HOP13_19015 [Alphaproteobacteria bacterium]|nr:hypothetical protein [Alphaproteobacteria bacterium]